MLGFRTRISNAVGVDWKGGPLTDRRKRSSVMLSGAKHLQYLFQNKEMQILRSAQDDSSGDLSLDL